ncbi:EDD domain protein, DegV family [Caloramator quimbayensis]|uniref:EDD domain protein, DegV family n=1 Tax=Caloramator quimbayensis TaxID=1147123 RepID=A0A1T4WSB7_9CLOT|nr:DegV family protein [Caloramator quimbayensis]SKA80226.1 EDD domain protein, DegV family [Caloramator quimbayensis]
METILITDSCSDLPLKYVEENGIISLGLTCHFKGKDYIDDFGKTLSYKEFYEEVRKGEMPTTSQVNTYRFEEVFKKFTDEGKAIIYIGFSSALSGTVGSALSARQHIMDQNKNADITVIDSKCASLGEGLLVYYANEMLKKGYKKDEVVKWVEDNKLKINHYFTVEDLGHLRRGGRVSGFAAALGTILDIKPVLHVDREGRLIPIGKVKGRKKSLKFLSDSLKERIINPKDQVITISHGDCLEDALYVKELILNDFEVKDFIINNVGPVVGSHSGPGTVALFFIGQER